MLIECPECKAQISDAAEACPKCGHPVGRGQDGLSLSKLDAKGPIGGLVALAGVIAVVVVVILATQSSNNSSPSTPAQVAAPTGGTNSENSPAPTAWKYSEDVDEMTDAKTELACTTSESYVTQSFPYEDVTADLCIRQAKRSGLNVYVSLNGKGQMLCDIEGCSLSVRFDKGRLRRFSAVEPSDHSTNALFIRNERAFVAQLKSSKIVTIEVELFENGRQDLIFVTSDLVWPRGK